MELLGKYRMLVKDCYVHYTALDVTHLDRLDTLSRAELTAFCKDNRLSQRTIQSLPGIFRACKRAAANDETCVEDLTMHQFVEALVRLAREQFPGKDNLPRRLTLFLQAVAKNSGAKVLMRIQRV